MMERVNNNPHIVKIQLTANRNFPNNKLPLLVYKNAFSLPERIKTCVKIIQQTFLRNRWGNTWKNGIYGFHHYHSTTHECMGICSGKVNIIVGGPGGHRVQLQKGDVIIIPAGVGHKCTTASDDFSCVGAYPSAKDYDINQGSAAALKSAKKRIKDLGVPSRDPLLGLKGFIKALWKK